MKSDIRTALRMELAQEERSPCIDAGTWPRPGEPERVASGRSVLNFASWDLLGLYGHRAIITAAHQALEESALSSGASLAGGGSSLYHSRLERRAAQFLGGEKALIFPSRNQAVLSIITAFCGEGVYVIGIEGSSLPLADACVLAGCEYIETNDEHLRSAIEAASIRGRVLVAVESVGLWTAHHRDIQRDLRLCEEFGAGLIIDESAALGLFGLRGAGSSDEYASHPYLFCRLGSFGLVGGVELCSVVGCTEFSVLLERRSWFLRNEMRPSPVLSASAIAALELLELSLNLRERLVLSVAKVRTEIRSMGWLTRGSSSVPFFGVAFSGIREAQLVRDALLQRGIITEAFAVRCPKRADAILRILLSLKHTDAHIARLVESFDEVRKR